MAQVPDDKKKEVVDNNMEPKGLTLVDEKKTDLAPTLANEAGGADFTPPEDTSQKSDFVPPDVGIAMMRENENDFWGGVGDWFVDQLNPDIDKAKERNQESLNDIGDLFINPFTEEGRAELDYKFKEFDEAREKPTILGSVADFAWEYGASYLSDVVGTSQRDEVLRNPEYESFLLSVENTDRREDIFRDTRLQEKVDDVMTFVFANENINMAYDKLNTDIEKITSLYQSGDFSEEDYRLSLQTAKDSFEQTLNNQLYDPNNAEFDKNFRKKDGSSWKLEDYYKMGEIAQKYSEANTKDKEYVMESLEDLSDAQSNFAKTREETLGSTVEATSEQQEMWTQANNQLSQNIRERSGRKELQINEAFASGDFKGRTFNSNLIGDTGAVHITEVKNGVRGFYEDVESEVIRLQDIGMQARIMSVPEEGKERTDSQKDLYNLSIAIDKDIAAVISEADKFADFYVKNVGTDKGGSMDELIKSYEQEGGDLEGVFSVDRVIRENGRVGSSIAENVLSSSLGDARAMQLDQLAGTELIFGNSEGALEGASDIARGVISYIGAASGAMFISAESIFEGVSRVVGASDAFSRTELSQSKNALFYINPDGGLFYDKALVATKTWNNLLEVAPEVFIAYKTLFSRSPSISTKAVSGASRGATAVLGGVQKIFGRQSRSVINAVNRMGSFAEDVYMRLRNGTNPETLRSAIGKVGSSWDRARRITNSIANLGINGPISSGVFEPMNAGVYSESDLLFDTYFGIAELGVDVFRYIKSNLNGNYGFYNAMKNNDFQESFAKRVFGYTDSEWDNIDSKEKSWAKQSGVKAIYNSLLGLEAMSGQGLEGTDIVRALFENAKLSKPVKESKTRGLGDVMRSYIQKITARSTATSTGTPKKISSRPYNVGLLENGMPASHDGGTMIITGKQNVDRGLKNWFDLYAYRENYANMPDGERVKFINAIIPRLKKEFGMSDEMISDIASGQKEDKISWFDMKMKEQEAFLKENGVNVSASYFKHYSADEISKQYGKRQSEGGVKLNDDEIIARSDFVSVMKPLSMPMLKVTGDIEKDMIINAYQNVIDYMLEGKDVTLRKRELLEGILAKKMGITNFEEITGVPPFSKLREDLISYGDSLGRDRGFVENIIDNMPRIEGIISNYLSAMAKSKKNVNLPFTKSQMAAMYVENMIAKGDSFALDALDAGQVELAIADVLIRGTVPQITLSGVPTVVNIDKLRNLKRPGINGGPTKNLFTEKELLDIQRYEVRKFLRNEGVQKDVMSYGVSKLANTFQKISNIGDTEAAQLAASILGAKPGDLGKILSDSIKSFTDDKLVNAVRNMQASLIKSKSTRKTISIEDINKRVKEIDDFLNGVKKGDGYSDEIEVATKELEGLKDTYIGQQKSLFDFDDMEIDNIEEEQYTILNILEDKIPEELKTRVGVLADILGRTEIGFTRADDLINQRKALDMALDDTIKRLDREIEEVGSESIRGKELSGYRKELMDGRDILRGKAKPQIQEVPVEVLKEMDEYSDDIDDKITNRLKIDLTQKNSDLVDQNYDIMVGSNFFGLRNIQSVLGEAYTQPANELDMILKSSTYGSISDIDKDGNAVKIPLGLALKKIFDDISIGGLDKKKFFMDLIEYANNVDELGESTSSNPLVKGIFSFLGVFEDTLNKYNMNIDGDVIDVRSWITDMIGDFSKVTDGEAGPSWRLGKYIDALSNEDIARSYAKANSLDEQARILGIPKDVLKELDFAVESGINRLSKFAGSIGGYTNKKGSLRGNIVSAMDDFVGDLNSMSHSSFHTLLLTVDRKMYNKIVDSKEGMEKFFKRTLSNDDFESIRSVFGQRDGLEGRGGHLKTGMRISNMTKAVGSFLMAGATQLIATGVGIIGTKTRKVGFDVAGSRKFQNKWKVGIMPRTINDEAIDKIGGGGIISTGLNIFAGILGTNRASLKEAFRSTLYSGYYQFTEIIHLERSMAEAMSEALEYRGYATFKDYDKYLESLSDKERIAELAEFQMESDYLVQQKIGTLFNPTMSKLAWNMRTVGGEVVGPKSKKVGSKIKLGLRNFLYFSMQHLSSWAHSHMRNYVDLIKDGFKGHGDRYMEIMKKEGQEKANQWLRNVMLRDHRMLTTVGQVVNMLGLADKMGRAGDYDERSGLDWAEVIYSPFQAFSSSSIGRIMMSTLKQMFAKDVGGRDFSEVEATATIAASQFIREMWRVRDMPVDTARDVYGALTEYDTPEDLKDNFVGVAATFINRLASYNSLMADELIRNGGTLATKMGPRSIDSEILPESALFSEGGTISFFYDLSTQEKLAELQNRPTSETIAYIMRAIPIFKGYYDYQFNKPDPIDNLIEQAKNDSNYINLTMKRDIDMSDQGFLSTHLVYNMTQRATGKFNTLSERSEATPVSLSDFDKDDIDVINSSRQNINENMATLLNEHMGDENYEAFVELMSSTNEAGEMQALYLLNYMEQQSPGSGIELLSATVYEEKRSLENKIKDELGLGYSDAFLSKLSPEADEKLNIYLAQKWTPLYREVDKLGYAESLNAYIVDNLIPEGEIASDYFSFNEDDVTGEPTPYGKITPGSYRNEDNTTKFGSSKRRNQHNIFVVTQMALDDERWTASDMENIFTALFIENSKTLNNEESKVIIGNSMIQAMDYIDASTISPERKTDLKAGIAVASASYMKDIYENEELMEKHGEHFDKMFSYLYPAIKDIEELKNDAELMALAVEIGYETDSNIQDFADKDVTSWSKYKRGYNDSPRAYSSAKGYGGSIAKAKNLIRKYTPKLKKIPKTSGQLKLPDYNSIQKKILQINSMIRDVGQLRDSRKGSRQLPKPKGAKSASQRTRKAKKLKLD